VLLTVLLVFAAAKASQRVVLIVLGVFVATTLSHTLIAVDTDLSPVVGLAYLQAAPFWATQVGTQPNTTVASAAENFLVLTENIVCLKSVSDRITYRTLNSQANAASSVCFRRLVFLPLSDPSWLQVTTMKPSSICATRNLKCIGRRMAKSWL
jgi:hypothetical protein